jgi:hypothetical protein
MVSVDLVVVMGRPVLLATVACTAASLTEPHLQQWLLDLVSILSY